MRKSELLELLAGIDGDPEVVVMSGRAGDAVGEASSEYTFDPHAALAAHAILDVHTGFCRDADGDMISIEIFRDRDEHGNDPDAAT